jgi:hypothetical protein
MAMTMEEIRARLNQKEYESRPPYTRHISYDKILRPDLISFISSLKRPLNVYCAGKITKNDWRHNLMSYRKLRDWGFYEEAEIQADWPVLENALRGGHNYTGPYFIADDHGSYHGEKTHGYGTESGTLGCDRVITSSMQLVHACQKAIDRSHLIFCWLPSETATSAFGTISEIGYAAALDKPVFIATDKDLDPDLWFVAHQAAVIYRASDSDTAYQQCLTYFS